MTEWVRTALCVVLCVVHGQRPRYQEATGSPGDYALRVEGCCDDMLDDVAAILGRTWLGAVHNLPLNNSPTATHL